MTISSQTSKNQYTANGSNTDFSYTFKIFEEGDIAVLLGDTLQTITTHYTVSGVGVDGGGAITFVTAPANGVIVTLKRAEPLLQSIDYTENDDFPAAAHEEGLDRSVIRDQTIQEQLDRALVLSEGSTVSGVTFPDPTGNAEKFVRVNSAADNFEYLDIASAGDLAVSAFVETLLDDADADEARGTLGLGDIATTNLIDEDDMVSDSATQAPSQQSVKAYVDGQALAAAEGAFTPTLTTTGTDFTSVVYNSSRAARYIKVGNLVHIQMQFGTDSVTVGSASGSVTIGGLPFSARAGGASGFEGHSTFSLANVALFAGEEPMEARVPSGGDYIELYYRNAVDGNSSGLAVADIDTGANKNIFTLSGTYITD